MENSARHERPLRLLGLRPAGSYAPSALRPRFALPPGIPRGYAPRPSASPHIEAPRGGRIVPPVAAPPPKLRTGHIGLPPLQGLAKKAGRRLRVEQATQVSRRSPIPPAPSRWEGERVALCRQGCRLRGASLASPAPPSLRLGPFQVRQGPGFALSIPARVLAFGCGPRQPGFRPLTHFPLKNREPRRIEGRHTAYSTRWRTRFHADGGQCSSVMADTVPR